MQTDRTTLSDLSIFAPGKAGVFHLLDHTTTQAGREALRKHILAPPPGYEELISIQGAVRFFAAHPDAWTTIITNGTLVLLDKFFESADSASAPQGSVGLAINSLFQRFLNRGQYSLTRFSVSHLADFIRGCQELIGMLGLPDLPPRLKEVLTLMQDELNSQGLSGEVAVITNKTPYTDLARLSYRARREMKNPVYRLMQYYARLDAWRSLAMATRANNWVFPSLQPPLPVKIEAKGLYHPLLREAVAYDIDFSGTRNFMLLTGANMSGKTTFMRAIGVSALLAHLGAGVPASAYTICFLEGIVTNMHVEDNLILGESYFFAEVQRIKQTARRLLGPGPSLVLMDELFKGTNVHDAFECTRAVISGLLGHKNHILVLSTHLYEVAQQFKDRDDIIFSCFATDLSEDGQYRFHYQLESGISDDRIGYRILQQEGVLELLQRGDSQEPPVSLS